MEASLDLFSLLSCAEQGEFNNHELQTAGMSASAGDKGSQPKKPRQSMKMKKVLKQSKAIKKSLKQLQLLAPNTVKNFQADRIKLYSGAN